MESLDNPLTFLGPEFISPSLSLTWFPELVEAVPLCPWALVLRWVSKHETK